MEAQRGSATGGARHDNDGDRLSTVRCKNHSLAQYVLITLQDVSSHDDERGLLPLHLRWDLPRGARSR